MKPDYVVCHYAEIGLKGKNRKFFEERLVENIKKALPKGVFKQVKRISGRIIIETDKDVRKELACVFGLSSFSPVFSCEKDIALIQKKALEVLKDKGFKTFKVDTRRSDKKFALTSQQVNEKVGEVIEKEVSAEVRGTKLDEKKKDLDKCIICNKKANNIVYVGKSY